MLCILFSSSFNQIMHFVLDTILSGFMYYSIQKPKNYNVSILSDQNIYQFDLVFPCNTEDNEVAR